MSQYKKIYCLLLLLLSGSLAMAQCYNGDWEANDFTGWTRWTSVNSAGNFDVPKAKEIPSQSTDFTRHVIQNAGNFDPKLSPHNIWLPTVKDGNHAIRLGDLVNNSGSEAMAYTFTVTNPNFQFDFAVVFENGHTEPMDNPFFSYVLHPGPANLSGLSAPFTMIKSKRYRSNTTLINLKKFGSLAYSDWETECIDLSAWVGQQVTIYFVTADCPYNGHFGYVYLDGLCKSQPPAVPDFTYANPICKYNELWVNGSISQNVTEYYWKIEEYWGGAVGAGTAETFYYKGAPGYIADLLTPYAQKGHKLRNGQYRITLGVKGPNKCIDWIEKSVIVNVTVPLFSFSQTIYKCCSDNNPPVFTSHADQSFTVAADAQAWHDTRPFQWFDPNGVELTTTTETLEATAEEGVFHAVSVFVPPHGQNGEYHVEYTDANGCKNVEYFYVVNKPEFWVDNVRHWCLWDCQGRPAQLTANYYYSPDNYCGSPFNEKLYNWSIKESHHTYQWSTGETTKTINTQPGVNWYTCTISNGCFTKTVTIDLNNMIYLSGPPTLAYPTAFTPNDDGLNDVFNIWDGSMPLWSMPAYKALEYHFSVYSRWGQRLFAQWSTAGCSGFPNYKIGWDGKYIAKKGRKKAYELGVYYWMMRTRNCNGWHTFATDVTLIK